MIFVLQLTGGKVFLFANVLCNIPILCISLIRIFGWKHSYCLSVDWILLISWCVISCLIFWWFGLLSMSSLPSLCCFISSHLLIYLFSLLWNLLHCFLSHFFFLPLFITSCLIFLFLPFISSCLFSVSSHLFIASFLYSSHVFSSCLFFYYFLFFSVSFVFCSAHHISSLLYGVFVSSHFISSSPSYHAPPSPDSLQYSESTIGGFIRHIHSHTHTHTHTLTWQRPSRSGMTADEQQEHSWGSKTNRRVTSCRVIVMWCVFP